jgi:hypothetical protein
MRRVEIIWELIIVTTFFGTKKGFSQKKQAHTSQRPTNGNGHHHFVENRK